MKSLLQAVVACALVAGVVGAQGLSGNRVPGAEVNSRSPQPPSPPGSGSQLSHEALPSASDYSARILPELKDVVSWRTLAQVVPVKQKDRFVPQFSDNIAKLDKMEIKVQGFMMPLEPGERQRRFLLTAVPADCSFCMPAGPDALVEVRAKTPVKYGPEPVVVSGRFVVLKDDPTGLFYRLIDAVPVSAR